MMVNTMLMYSSNTVNPLKFVMLRACACVSVPGCMSLCIHV